MPSFVQRWEQAIAEALAGIPGAPRPTLAESDVAVLPSPVARYVRASGAVGRPRPGSVRVENDALMRRAPGTAWMPSTTRQVNTFAAPTRSFHLRSRMFGLPVQALHLYRDQTATFQVRIAGLRTIVDQAGLGLSRVESVTVLNDWCVMAPGALVDDRLAWDAVDDRTARVVFTNGPHRVAATLRFNDADELVDFWSDDRPDTSSGCEVPMRWSTPLSDYRDFGGIRLASRGLAVYERPDGPFAYGEFTLRSVEYDLRG
jgi:hypothetical protein